MEGYLADRNPVLVDQLEQVELLLLRDLVVFVQLARRIGVAHAISAIGLIKIKKNRITGTNYSALQENTRSCPILGEGKEGRKGVLHLWLE